MNFFWASEGLNNLFRRHWMMIGLASLSLLLLPAFFPSRKPIPAPKQHTGPKKHHTVVDKPVTLPSSVYHYSLDNLRQKVKTNLVYTREEHSAIPTSVSLSLFENLLDDLTSQISTSIRRHSILLVEGSPGIGKGVALESLAKTEQGIYLNLSDILPDLSNLDEQPEELSDQWVNSLKKALGFTLELRHLVEEQEFNTFAFQVISSALRSLPHKPLMFVVDNIQLLFSHQDLLSNVYSGIVDSLFFLMQCQTEGLLTVILGCSSKSALIGFKRIRGLERRVRFKSLEAGVADEEVIEYLLTQINPMLPAQRKFGVASASLFVETFEANLYELGLYLKSDLTLPEFIEERESHFLEFLNENIPRQPGAESPFNPFLPTSPLAAGKEFREIILDMIMRNGVLPLSHMDTDHLALIEVLVENNFLRWRNTPQRASRSRRSANNSSGASRANSPTPTMSTTSWDDGSHSPGSGNAYLSIPGRMGVDGSIDTLTPIAVRRGSFDDQDVEEDEEMALDPLSFLRRCNTELVWFNRLVRNVCERWFNESVGVVSN